MRLCGTWVDMKMDNPHRASHVAVVDSSPPRHFHGQPTPPRVPTRRVHCTSMIRFGCQQALDGPTVALLGLITFFCLEPAVEQEERAGRVLLMYVARALESVGTLTSSHTAGSSPVDMEQHANASAYCIGVFS